jgi:hypothetical protein
MLIGTKLLHSAFNYHGMAYDVYGLPATEDDECVIDAICLAGRKVNVMYLLTEYDIQMIAYWVGVQRQMDYLTELREARADSAMYDREAAKLNHQWRSL